MGTHLQVREHPLADITNLKNFQWPNPDDPQRYAGFPKQMAGAGDKFVMFCFGQGIWERLHMLLGMDKAMLAFVRHDAYCALAETSSLRFTFCMAPERQWW